MNDKELLEMLDRVTANEVMAQVDESLENFCAQIMDAAPQASMRFQQTLEHELMAQEVKKPILRVNWQRPARVAALIVALFLTVAVVYAIDAIVQRARQMDAGLSGVEGHELNLSQTIDVYTVNLQWAHADANRVSIAMAITGAGDAEYTNLTPRGSTLSDDAGHVFRTSGGFGAAVEDGMGGEVVTFDTSSLAELPEVLNLRLEMSIDVLTTQSRTQTPNGDYEDWNIGPVGTFVFEFSLPTTDALLLEMGETVEANGVAVTLQRVTISESQTRVVLCFDVPDASYSDWLPIVNLYVNGQNVIETWDSPGGGGFIEGTNCTFAMYNAPLIDQSGEWRVEVTQLVGMRTEIDDTQAATMAAISAAVHEDSDTTSYSMPEGGLEAAGVEMRVDGPWVFSFDVP